MKEFFGTVFGVVIGLVTIGGLLVGGYELSYRMFQHYAPRYEQVRRETYEQSRAYQEGTVRDLENLRLEYGRAQTDSARAAIKDTVRERSADLPDDLQLSPSLQAFLDQMKDQ